MSDAPNLNAANLQSANHGGRGQNVLFESGARAIPHHDQPPGSNDDIFTNDDGQVAAGLNPNDSVLGSSGTSPTIQVKSSR